MKGEEMSFFVISDGKTFKLFGTAQDHKRVFEGDKIKILEYGSCTIRLETKELNEKILKNY